MAPPSLSVVSKAAMTAMPAPPIATPTVRALLPFQYIPEHGLLVCQDCAFAVTPRRISGHLKSDRHNMPPLQRVAIEEAVRAIQEYLRTAPQFPQLIDTLLDAAVFRSNTPPPPTIPGLPVFHTGHRCIVLSSCRFIASQLDAIRRHIDLTHPEVQSDRPGRGSSWLYRRDLTVSDGESRTYISNITYQKLITGQNGILFEVIPTMEAAAMVSAYSFII